MRWERVTRLGTAAIAGLALPGLLVAATDDPPAPILISVAGRPAYAVAGSTVAQMASREGLHPRAGNLVSVTGGVLWAGRYPGHLDVNGRVAGAAAVLRAGDRLTVVDGRDRREPVRTVVTPSPAGEPPSPEYYLGRAPGLVVQVIGRISGQVASTGFRATGPVHTPNAVALTFDDGPWPGSTRAILRILIRKRVPATFFLIGEQVPSQTALVRAELRAGMEVGDHSWDHPLSPPLADLSPAHIHDELSFTRTVEVKDGAEVTAFRPPGGSWSDQVARMAAAQGMRVVLWSVDPRDWAPGATAKGIVRNVLSHVGPGSIVLMHDGGGNRSQTVKALPRIIDGIRKRGLKLVEIER